MPVQHIKEETLDVAWLLWLDAIERLDTILLEIRHSQINLIHALRTPELYEPLRYEEDYLWGEYTAGGVRKPWQELLADVTQVRLIERWVAAWIIPYPSYADSWQKVDTESFRAPGMAKFCKPSRHCRILRRLRKAFRKQISNGDWSADNRRLYHALSSLQLLKANVLRDKLILCRWGIKAVAARQDANAALPADLERTIGRFLLVRSAIMEQAHRHVQNLGDLKAQFDSALDLGIQDHPKPMTRRRREQGLYSAYLSDRCRQLSELLQDYLLQDFPAKQERPKFRGALYAHRWSHSATSSASVLRDGISSQEWRSGGRDTDLVNTSFWMPDRPDLQSVIAHEVAHTALHHAYGNLEPYCLRDAHGSFPRLLRLLSTTLDSFGMTRYPVGDPRYAHDHALNELACDLLAATVSGPAYLFALVQEIIGLDLDCLFRSPQHEIDFDLADSWLDDGWAALSLPGFEWFYRLRLVCAWTKATATHEPLCERLVSGVESLCQILLETVGDLGPKGVEPHIATWKVMTDVMVNVARDSDALAEAKRWRKSLKTPPSAADRPFDPNKPCPGFESLQFLSPETRNTLQALIVRRKRSRLLKNRTQDQALAEFPEIYLTGNHPRKAKVSDLFHQLQDIPWQSAMLRARDFLHPSGAMHRPQMDGQWLTEMHVDGAPGRELYQIALEFAYWQHTSPRDPMTAILRLWSGGNAQEFEVAKLRGYAPTLSDKDLAAHSATLQQWCEKEGPNLAGAVRAAISQLLRNPASTDQAVASVSPHGWVDAPLFAADVLNGQKMSIGQQRTWLSHLQQKKLAQLCRAAEPFKAHPLIEPVHAYLRSTSEASSLPQAGSRVIESELLKGFLTKDDGDGPLPKLVMLERTAATQLGNYAERVERGPFVFDNGRISYHPLMGRYDLFGINTSDNLWHPRLPYFNHGELKDDMPPFFVRHEMAIAFNLFPNQPTPFPAAALIPLAFVSVTLNSRSDRLDFLYQLKDTTGLGKNDLVMLSEGWGDVIIAVQVPQTEIDDASAAHQRLIDVFDLQKKLFENFLVERTELILTFRSLASAIAKGVATSHDDFLPFSLLSRVRINKHAYKGPASAKANEEFCGELNKILAGCPSKRAFDVVRTPGRTDFSVFYRCRHLLADEEMREKLLKTTSGMADDVLTVISIREIDNSLPDSSACTHPCRFRDANA